MTGADGTVALKLPADMELGAVMAWHPTLGVGGQLDHQKGLHDDSFRLVLLDAAVHTIRFLTVDGQAVPDLAFSANVRTPEETWISTGSIPAALLRANADGQVCVPWFPKDILHVDVGLISDDWKVDEVERDKLAEGMTTVRVRSKIPVSGRLKMPAGASAEGILVSGFGFGPQSRGDIPTARAAADGSFTLLVAADHGYALNISDTAWASDGWTGLILADDNAKPADIVLDVYPATPLEVRVVRGEKHEGIAGAWIHLSAQMPFNWRDSQGKQQSASFGSVGDWMRTGAGGVARLGAGKGKHKVRLSLGDWNEERTVEAEPDMPLVVEFYRAWLTNRKITGRLLSGGAPHKPSSSATIEAAAIAQPYQRFSLQSTLQPDGTFEVAGDASDVSIIVMDRGRRAGGFVRVGPNDKTVVLPLTEMGSYGGVIVDTEQGSPHAGKTLRIVVRDTDHLAAEDQVSAVDGRFKFPVVAAGVPLTLQVRQPAEAGTYFRPIGKLFFTPGEMREDQRLAVDLRDQDGRRTRPNAAGSLLDQLAKTVRNARVAGMHALVVLQGDASEKVTAAAEIATNDDDQPDVLAYLPLIVDHELVKASAPTIKDYGWRLPQPGEVVLVALDGDAQLLGSERLVAADISGASKLAAALYKKHLPPVRDAQARLAAAQEEAKRTGRKLWIVEGGMRCGPCFRLARWMDDQHAVLETDYVILKVMNGLDQHSEDVLKPLNRPHGGIPWYAIMEADGKVLTTSDSVLGNIGMPSSVEGIRHLREMLERTAQRLAAEDIDQLAESLRNFK